MSLPQINIGDGLLGDALLSSIEVAQELNQHWRCTVVCRQTEDQRIPTEDLLGQPVEVKTIDEDGVEHLHFSGFVYDVALSYEVWGSYTARLMAVSDSYALDVAAHKQYYMAGTLASLAETLAGRSGLSVDVKAPGSKALNYVQYGETDFSFLNRIVDDHGAWLRPAAGGVEVFAAFQAGSKVQWRDHDGLLAFSLTGTLAPASFSGSHYDHHGMQSNTFQQIAKPPEFYDGAQRLTGAVQTASRQLPAGFEPQRARAMTLDEYSGQLGAESERSMGGAITGEGESRHQLLMAGNTVEIEGVLDAAGTYGLLKVVHQWTPTGYGNHFVCTPWKNYRNPRPPAMRLWEGVSPARVTAHDDPKKMGRLRVQFFWQEDGATHWARMVSPHAGPDRGMMMMPEVGDEVAVMFEDGDPERPVIVGSLWNGVQQAPRAGFFGPDADIPTNDVKRIVTKSGHRLQMVDTPGTETVVLATPNHTHLHMTEKHDSTGRTLIHLHSDGDIILTAPKGRVHIQSQFFSREIGTGGAAAGASVAGAPAPAQANPTEPLDPPVLLAAAFTPPDICAKLAKEIDDLVNRDKRLNNNGGTHGLKHRFREQVEGANGPGTDVWDRHQEEISRQQDALRRRLKAFDDNDCGGGGSPVPVDAWKWATRPLPRDEEWRGPQTSKVTPPALPQGSGIHPFDLKYWEKVTGLSGAALIAFLILWEGLARLFPPRNLVPA